MKKLTDAEKQQLQAKIKDERERQHQAVRDIVRRNEEDSKRMTKGARRGFLGLLLGLFLGE